MQASGKYPPMKVLRPDFVDCDVKNQIKQTKPYLTDRRCHKILEDIHICYSHTDLHYGTDEYTLCLQK